MLTDAIGNLKLSDKCKSYLEGLNINSLQDFISKGWGYYHEGQKQDKRLFNEVIRYLSKNDLLHHMEGK